MDIHEKTVRNMIDGYVGISNSNMTSDITRTCEIRGRATKSINDHVCEECRNEIRRLFREHRMQ